MICEKKMKKYYLIKIKDMQNTSKKSASVARMPKVMGAGCKEIILWGFAPSACK